MSDYTLDDGTFVTTLAGTELMLKLTYRNMQRLDKELRNINTFIMRSTHNNISMDDVINIIYFGSLKNHKFKKEDIGEMIFTEGMFDSQTIAVQFLVFAMNGGKEIPQLDESDIAEKKSV